MYLYVTWGIPAVYIHVCHDSFGQYQKCVMISHTCLLLSLVCHDIPYEGSFKWPRWGIHPSLILKIKRFVGTDLVVFFWFDMVLFTNQCCLHLPPLRPACHFPRWKASKTYFPRWKASKHIQSSILSFFLSFFLSFILFILRWVSRSKNLFIKTDCRKHEWWLFEVRAHGSKRRSMLLVEWSLALITRLYRVVNTHVRVFIICRFLFPNEPYTDWMKCGKIFAGFVWLAGLPKDTLGISIGETETLFIKNATKKEDWCQVVAQVCNLDTSWQRSKDP